MTTHAATPREEAAGSVDRRGFLGVGMLLAGTALGGVGRALASEPAPLINLAKVATPTSLYVSGDTRITALNDGFVPADSADAARGTYGNWPKTGTQWVQYDWARPIRTGHVDIYWWVDGAGVGAPSACRLLYRNGSDWTPVAQARGLGVARDRFNATTFAPVQTTGLRLEMISDGPLSTGILEWRVYSAGPPPAFAPIVDAGIDRSVIVGGQTYLMGKADWLDPKAGNMARWRMVSGPGHVRFADAAAAETTASFSSPGDYVLELGATADGQSAASRLSVRAAAPPPSRRLDVVYTTRYALDNPLWNARAKALIVNWIPHCVAYCERTDLQEGQGGLDNFVAAGRALRGLPHDGHKGYVFANAWVHQTVEAMCIALMVDAQGDREILAAQEQMRRTLEDWIPKILSAQEPDGYLQTAYTLADRREWPSRWDPDLRGNHEGYTAGYFIESAINHHTLTDGRDLRLYDAAKKLADCWVANIGPGKKPWFDGHQEMEQALVRFGRFVNDVEGGGRGDAYVVLAKFLLDSRRGGQEYDQSHLPPARQYEAVGHAVRATYFYSGMADIAAETGDKDYQSAVLSLWDNMVNRKFYLTGGIGSGETSEGFGPNYSLRNDAYCESCSSCGLIFFQYKLNLAYHDAKFADLYEQTMYNALLGAVDLAGRNFCYTNPLVNTERTPWHVCPCCVGNIPRTLLMVPTWSYVKGAGGVHVNLFIGGTVQVGNVAGVHLEMVQKTDYPWSGRVAITVNPARPTLFAVRVRVPDRATSALYTQTPRVSGLVSLAVNGSAIPVQIDKGYAVIIREWAAGDKIELELPMVAQIVRADPRIGEDADRVALQYGPLIYNFETADQSNIERALADTPITPQWRGDLLGGVMTLTGRWADGSPMVAIPNFSRMNRTGQVAREFASGDVDYAPGTGKARASGDPAPAPDLKSQVWVRAMA